MNDMVSEVLKFVEENDVKFIRLAFCDVFGTQKNVAIMPEELPRAFESGVSLDSSAVRGFLNPQESDLFLVPDPGTLSILPWRPSHGRVIRLFCDIRYPDGKAFEGDNRSILKRAAARAASLGYVCKVGSECEFYLFETDEKGNPTMHPQDSAEYCDIAPRDRGENVRREICLTLEQMGIHPENSHHEQGPGQNEIDFKYSDVLSAADNLITFKSVVKTIAARNGLYASFMPKPIPEKSGSGMHINLSLFRNKMNLFRSDGGQKCDEASCFMAGILERVPEMTAFLNPLTNSYARFGSFDAPKYLTWSHQNRSQLIRIPAASGDYCRMELRSPDPSCNPHLSFALLLSAGLDGIERKLQLGKSAECGSCSEEQSGAGLLPQSLGEALKLAENSSFVRGVIGEPTLRTYCEEKSKEWKRYQESSEKEKLDHELYFDVV